ncbi:hypothetical protein [Paracoccus cavernae]|uniref:hypothetical protein n=1 Tax=Paracoccus cavernae TaxID=1571207 RepID=UPI00363CD324
MIAGPGEDDLSGDDGDDLLIGSSDPARAWLHGGAGEDTLHARDGDFAEGGAGDDLFVLLAEPGTTVPVIGDFTPARTGWKSASKALPTARAPRSVSSATATA